MKAGRQLDQFISEEVLGYKIKKQKREIFETTPKGTRPLRAYSTEIGDAWEVVEAFGITLIPIENGYWFALVGAKDGFRSPADFIEFLQAGNFVNAGAAVEKSAPLTVCLAAIKAMESRRNAEARGEQPTEGQSPDAIH